MWSLLFIHSPLQSSWNCIAPLRQMNRSRNAFKSIFYLELLRRDYKVTVGKTGNKKIAANGIHFPKAAALFISLFL